MLKITSFGKSDVGLKRSNNEDAFAVNPEQGFLALADGMGGEVAGEVASQLFIETALEVFSRGRSVSEQEILDRVQKTFQLSNEKILNHVEQHPEHQGMGCTAELVAFSETNFVLGHVGDSRTYLYRGGQLRQLTKDHSFIQTQIDQGVIPQTEAKRHSLKHVILRAVGIEEALAVDLIRGKSVPGDLFLLCSDGLTDMVEDRSIQDILLSPLLLHQKVEGLIDLSKSAGGQDNITVVLCEVM